MGVFVITGGGSGIGKALALALAARGRNVFIMGRRESLLQQVASQSPRITYGCGDVSTTEGRHRLVQYVQTASHLEGLIHNAATIDPMTSMLTMDEPSWRHIMATNVEAPLFLTQALSSLLSGGRVLHIGSGAAYFPVQGWSAYCVSKAALSMLTRCWQLEASAFSVASVMPGIIDTDMQARIRETSVMDIEKNIFFKELKRTGRLLSPETVALFLCWLLLDVTEDSYRSKEWDIYDVSHHKAWLFPPHVVPMLD